MVGNILVTESAADRITVKSHWTVHTYSFRTNDTALMHGRSVHVLERRDSWGIAAKTVYLHSDYVASKLDFYNI